MGFLDKITGSINSAGENVVKRAKDAAEISKCNSQIEECRSRIENIYREIGEYFWKNRQKLEADDVLRQKLLQIENASVKMNVLKNELVQLRLPRGAEICRNCGAELKKNANFCNVCGTPVVRETEKKQVCKNCGAELSGDEKFCMNCGAKVEVAGAEPERPQISPKMCGNCGKELRDDDAFCRFCGTPAVRFHAPGDTGVFAETEMAKKADTEE